MVECTNERMTWDDTKWVEINEWKNERKKERKKERNNEWMQWNEMNDWINSWHESLMNQPVNQSTHVLINWFI